MYRKSKLRFDRTQENNNKQYKKYHPKAKGSNTTMRMSTDNDRGDYDTIPDIEQAQVDEAAVIIDDESPLLMMDGDDNESDSESDEEDDLKQILLDLQKEEDEEQPSSVSRGIFSREDNGVEASTTTKSRLLFTLDKIIELPTPKIQLPPIQPRHLSRMSSSLGGGDGSVGSHNSNNSVYETLSSATVIEFLQAIKVPTLVVLATLVAASTILIEEGKASSSTSPKPRIQQLRHLFPYLACFAGLLALIHATQNRFAKKSEGTFRSIDTTEGKLLRKVDKVSNQVTTLVDKIQIMIDNVLEPIKPKLDKLNKVENMLNKFIKDEEDKIDIPDPNDIQEVLDGCTDAIEAKMDTVKSMINFHKHIPVYLRSFQNIKFYALYPILGVFILLQLFAVYYIVSSTTAKPNEAGAGGGLEDDNDHGQTLFIRHLLRGSGISIGSSRWRQLLVDKTDADSASSEESGGIFSEHYMPIWISMLIFIVTIIQLSIVFVMTSSSTICKILNVTLIKTVNDTTDRVLTETGVTELFDSYLTTKMIIVRDKISNVISKLDRIENVLHEKIGLDSIDDLDSIKEEGLDISNIQSIDDLKDIAKAKLMSKLTNNGGVGDNIADFAKDKLNDFVTGSGATGKKKNIFRKWGNSKK